VLDVGCGPGHLTAHLRSLDVDTAGIDVVPAFLDHARASYPDGRFALASIHRLPVPDSSVAGILAWYSLIHLPPDDLDSVLDELGRAMAAGATLVAGFFDGDEIAALEHKVTTAYFWPVDELSARLRRAGLVEVERQRRPAIPQTKIRSQAAIAAIAQ
jgi:ubiquinone/menaquinone biosynthesis C-methylase UbiE